MNEEKIVAGDGRGSVCIYDIRLPNVFEEIPSHSSSAWSVSVDEDHIISGSVDNSINIFNMKPHPQRKFTDSAFANVFSVRLDATKAAIGDSNGTITVLDFEDSLKWKNGKQKQLREAPTTAVLKIKATRKNEYNIF